MVSFIHIWNNWFIGIGFMNNKKKERVYLYDSTLRDGAQTSTVNFNSRDKREISSMLDELGIDCYRAKDINVTSSIDKVMLQEIMNAETVK